MAAHEHHAELVVFDGSSRRFRRLSTAETIELELDLVRARVERLIAAQHIQGAVSRHTKEPPARVLRHAGVRPLLERLDERVLHDLLREIEVRRPEDPCEPRDHLPRPAAEQMVD